MNELDKAALKDLDTLTREMAANLPPAIGALVLRQLTGAAQHICQRLEQLASLEEEMNKKLEAAPGWSGKTNG